MATYNFMKEQVQTNDQGQAVSTTPITSSTPTSSGALTNVQAGYQTSQPMAAATTDTTTATPGVTPAVPGYTPIQPRGPAAGPAPVPGAVGATPSNPTAQEQGNPQFDQQGMLIPGTGGLAATPSPSEQAFNAIKDSGAKSPQESGPAGNAVKAATEALTPADFSPQIAKVENQLSQDPGYQQLLADRAEYNKASNQSASMVDTYNQMIKDSGIAGMNTDLLNMKNVIDGTEGDIRKEVQAAGGFATDSQVMALSSARNKQLIKNYNSLLDSKNMAMEQVNNMVGLASKDREFALNSITQKLQIDQQVNDYRDKFVNNAKEAYNQVLQAVGYGGLYQSLVNSGDPNAVSLAEKTMGLAPGGLQGLASYVKPLSKTEQLDYDAKQFQLQQAQQMAPLDLQAKQGNIEAQKFDLQQAKANAPLDLQLKRAQINAANRANIPQPKDIPTQVIDVNGKKMLINSQTGAVINEIGADPVQQTVKAIVAGASGWGDAADKINKAFGDPNAATRYDAQLKAHFQNGQPVDTAFTASTPQMQQAAAQSKGNIDLIDQLKNNSGLNAAVGPNAIARGGINLPFGLGIPTSTKGFTGERQNFLASVQQLTSQLSLDTLIRAKANGATFGALSEGELGILSGSASKIANWATKDSKGNVTGYNASEKDFRTELDKIGNFAKLDYILKGGNPGDIGVQTMPDGTHWVQNSDGTMTQF